MDIEFYELSTWQQEQAARIREDLEYLYKE